jgi:UDP-2,4-diacetamido-2,4,6-trideoxy-beta-L-altropyranose hydrolase
MRMLALAQAWRKAKGNVLFLCAEITAALEAKIEAERFPLEKMAVTPGSRGDLEATIFAIDRNKGAGSPYPLALDGYHFNADFQLGLKNTGARLLLMDDFGHSEFYHADFILNQNISARADLYAQRTSNTELLLGPRYALLRTEFSACRSWSRAIPERAAKLLVTMGGADPDNVTEKVINALADSGLEVKAVVGGSNPHLASLRQAAMAASKGATSVELVINASNMPELMRWADMAIAAGGSTAYELAFTGLPTLFVILAGNQEESTLELERQGFGICLGDRSQFDKHHLQKELEALAGNHKGRASFARRGRQIVDGMGSERVVAVLTDDRCLCLEPVTKDDLRLLWEWANDPSTRKNSFQPEKIPWDDHLKWGLAKIGDPDCCFWMASAGELGKVGVVRFDLQHSEATISVSLAPHARGKGYATRLIASGCLRIFKTGSVELVHAWIKPTNEASIRAFQRANFTHLAIEKVNAQEAQHYILRKVSS